jgi:hypothetical protein
MQALLELNGLGQEACTVCSACSGGRWLHLSQRQETRRQLQQLAKFVALRWRQAARVHMPHLVIDSLSLG